MSRIPNTVGNQNGPDPELTVPKATAVWSSPSLCGAEVQVSRHLVGQLLVEQAVQSGELLVVGGGRVEEGQRDEDVPQGAVGQLGQYSAQAHQQHL